MNEPNGHGVGAVAPTVSTNDPAGAWTHGSAPVAEYEPAAHGTGGSVVVVVVDVVVVGGSVVVVVVDVVVVGIGRQEFSDVAPSTEFVVPSGHAVGSVAPVAST